ncbi:transmembrane 6 superfamily member 1-like [Saccoglossus kowalevskii]
MSGAAAVFVMSLTAIPVTYTVNLMHFSKDHFLVFVCGVVVLLAMTTGAYLIGKLQKRPPRDKFFYVCGVFSFTCVVDFIIALELDGVMDGFMTFYLKEGEPYLNSAHGTFINYWDGTGHYIMYLSMAAAMSWHVSYRDIGLYWAGSIINSMVVFMPGNLIGKNGRNVKASYFLNTPYVIIPLMMLHRLLSSKRKLNTPQDKVAKSQKKSLLWRPLDILLIVSLLFAIAVASVRGMAALDSPMTTTQVYLQRYEPYLTDDVIYPKLQMLVYLFYFVPYYIMAVYSLIYPGKQWMIDWSIIHAGAAAQAQFTHIGCSFHDRTAAELRVPMDTRLVFWIINLALLIIPQVLALRCVYYPEFFLSNTQNQDKIAKKAPQKKKKQ